MPVYAYLCTKCNFQRYVYKEIKDSDTKEKCKCGNEMYKDFSGIGITGTRDNFGVGKAFVNEQTGQTIDNWKSWERAGYKSALEHSDPNIRDQVKRKVEKITKYDSGARKSIIV